MRRFLALASLLLACAFACKAQSSDTTKVVLQDLYNTAPVVQRLDEGELSRYHGSLVFLETGHYLNPSNVDSAFWKQYRTASSLSDWGQYLWTFGVGCIAADLIFSLPYGRGEDFLSYNMVVGGVMLLIGIPMDVAGHVKLGKLADQYNSEHSTGKEVSLHIGQTQHGYGIALNF